MLGQSGVLAGGKGRGERNDGRVNGRHCIYGIMCQVPSELTCLFPLMWCSNISDHDKTIHRANEDNGTD